MTCPKCGFKQDKSNTECPNCGIIFEKYSSRQRKLSGEESFDKSPPVELAEAVREKNPTVFLRDLFLNVRPQINVFYFAGRVIVFLLILIGGIKFIITPMKSNYAGQSFMHMINLPFHEAGHIIFRPFGQFLMALGGSLTQILIPLICLIVFLIKTRDTFAASITLWWTGENLMDLAPYINDARELKLILLGGVTGRDVENYHDWEFILRKLGWLRYDHILAYTANSFGIVLIVTALLWGGMLLYKQFRNIDI